MGDAAWHLDLFDQPGKKRVFQQRAKGPEWCEGAVRREPGRARTAGIKTPAARTVKFLGNAGLK